MEWNNSPSKINNLAICTMWSFFFNNCLNELTQSLIPYFHLNCFFSNSIPFETTKQRERIVASILLKISIIDFLFLARPLIRIYWLCEWFFHYLHTHKYPTYNELLTMTALLLAFIKCLKIFSKTINQWLVHLHNAYIYFISNFMKVIIPSFKEKHKKKQKK